MVIIPSRGLLLLESTSSSIMKNELKVLFLVFFSSSSLGVGVKIDICMQSGDFYTTRLK